MSAVATAAIPQSPSSMFSRGAAAAKKLANSSGIRLDSLLVCQDAQMLGALRRALDLFDVETTIAGTPDKAEESILNSKFDVIIVDLANRDYGANVLRSVRKTRLNKRTMVIAIADDYARHQAAFHEGANFTVPRMSTLDQATRCLRSSYYMMLRQRRSSMRFPLDIPAVLHTGDRKIEVRMLNLSETGVGMQTACELAVGDIFTAALDLPGTGKPVKLTAKTVWVNATGIAGASFVNLEDATIQNLQDWINGNLMGRFEFVGGK